MVREVAERAWVEGTRPYGSEGTGRPTMFCTVAGRTQQTRSKPNRKLNVVDLPTWLIQPVGEEEKPPFQPAGEGRGGDDLPEEGHDHRRYATGSSSGSKPLTSCSVAVQGFPHQEGAGRAGSGSGSD